MAKNTIAGQVHSFSEERRGRLYGFRVTLDKNLTECGCEAWKYSAQGDYTNDHLRTCKHQPIILQGLLDASQSGYDLSQPITIVRSEDGPVYLNVLSMERAALPVYSALRNSLNGLGSYGSREIVAKSTINITPYR